MLETLSLSDVLGYASIGCWLGAQFPQVIENFKLKSCEGLALPFLANWLLGDISNLIGCILTHQLPFQTWLATYFVCVDFMLVAQYAYYYKPPKGISSILGRIRSATSTSPSVIRRLSIERGVSRYRTLSVVASNVAAAAAIAAQKDDHTDLRRSSTRYSKTASRLRRYDGSSSQDEEDVPAAMIESFRSEGRDAGQKRVSWSIERHRSRAASVGRGGIRPTTPSVHHILPTDILVPARSTEPHDLTSQQEAIHLSDSTESLTQIVSSKGSRLNRKGSSMVFLGAWVLIGVGTFFNAPLHLSLKDSPRTGRVLPPTVPIETSLLSFPWTTSSPYSRIVDPNIFGFADVNFVEVHRREVDPTEHPLPEDPSSEQILGRFFAWLCTTLYLTSRLPQIWKNVGLFIIDIIHPLIRITYVRKSVEGLSMYLFVFAFLGNTFYVASILVSLRRFLPDPESTQFLRESIPYLLGSAGTLLFDVTIVTQSFFYRPRHRRHPSTSHTRALDEEEAGLLSGDVRPSNLLGDSAILSRGRTSRTRGTS